MQKDRVLSFGLVSQRRYLDFILKLITSPRIGFNKTEKGNVKIPMSVSICVGINHSLHTTHKYFRRPEDCYPPPTKGGRVKRWP